MRLLVLLGLLAMPNLAAAQERIAFFGITLLDDSLQSSDLGSQAELARIAMLEDMVRTRFADAGYVLMDIEPVQAEIDRIVNPAKCYGCDTRAAASLGADFSLVGEVQKVSNLILTMNLQLRDAETGDMVKGRVVDIRGNTDDSWTRGMRYILKTTFFPE